MLPPWMGGRPPRPCRGWTDRGTPPPCRAPGSACCAASRTRPAPARPPSPGESPHQCHSSPRAGQRGRCRARGTLQGGSPIAFELWGGLGLGVASMSRARTYYTPATIDSVVVRQTQPLKDRRGAAVLECRLRRAHERGGEICCLPVSGGGAGGQAVGVRVSRTDAFMADCLSLKRSNPEVNAERLPVMRAVLRISTDGTP
jgi:hypothetical protein